MFNNLNSVRLVPQDKDKTGRIVLGFVLALVLGFFMAVADTYLITALSILMKSNDAYIPIRELGASGFFIGIDVLILFLLSVYSRKPLFSALYTLTFFASYIFSLYLYYATRNMLSFEATRNNFLLKLIVFSCLLVAFTVLNYFMWYSKGKGKAANILGYVAVAGTIALSSLPIFRICRLFAVRQTSGTTAGLVQSESITLITSIIDIVVFIAISVIMGLILRNKGKERNKSFIVSIPCGVVVCAILFFAFSLAIPLESTTYLI